MIIIHIQNKSKEISSSNPQFSGTVCILGVMALTKKKDADISVISHDFYPLNSQGFRNCEGS